MCYHLLDAHNQMKLSNQQQQHHENESKNACRNPTSHNTACLHTYQQTINRRFKEGFIKHGS